MGAKKKPNNEPLLVLFPIEGEDSDGYLLLQEEKTTKLMPVKRYVGRQGTSRRFQPFVQLLSLGKSQPDYPKLKANFRILVEKAFGGTRLTDAVSEQALINPKLWSRRWLPPLFNSEIKGTRMVMWWPEDARQFSPAIYCKDEETAIFVSLLFREVELCPGCGLPFIRRRKQRFHSTNCAARYRMARFRKREEQRKKKGKRNAKN